MSASKRKFNKKLLACIEHKRKLKPKYGLDENLAKSWDGFGTLLHYAALHGNEHAARHLLRLGSDVDRPGKDGQTPLMLALRNNHKAVVKVLLKAEADVEIADANGESALRMAVGGHDDTLSLVDAFIRKLQAEARASQRLVERLAAADANMYHAARTGRLDLMKRMLQRGIDIDSRGLRDKTALHLAVEANDSNLAKWLLNNGADADATDDVGASSLLMASSDGRKDMLRILLEAGADPSPDCPERNAPIFRAFDQFNRTAREEYLECAQLLMQYSANPRNATRVDFRIFHRAELWSNDRVVKLLTGQLAMLQMLGRPISKSVVSSSEEVGAYPEILHLNNFYQGCLRVLGVRVSSKLSLLELLNVSEQRMLLLARKSTCVALVEQVCWRLNLRDSFPYYYSTLMTHVDRARRVLRLEHEAIPVICKILHGNYNQCYGFARKVAGYLTEYDLEQLVQV